MIHITIIHPQSVLNQNIYLDSADLSPSPSNSQKGKNKSLQNASKTKYTDFCKQKNKKKHKQMYGLSCPAWCE